MNPESDIQSASLDSIDNRSKGWNRPLRIHERHEEYDTKDLRKVVLPQPPGLIGIVVERLNQKDWQTWPHADFFLIAVLWWFDALAIFFDAWKDGLLNGRIIDAENVELQGGNTYDGLLIIVIITTVLSICHLANKWTFKYWIVVGCLHLYVLSSIFTIFLLFKRTKIIAIIIDCLQIGWFVARPLKYFLAFHQRFPIRVIHSKIIVTSGEVILGLSSYISAVCITNSEGLSKAGYLIALSLLLVLMLIWMGLVHCAKFFSCERPIDYESIRDIYKKNSRLAIFLFKNEQALLFSLILVPSVIFILLEHTVNISLLSHKDSIIYIYRLDILMAVLFMCPVEIIFHFIPWLRDELEDLYAICVAHFVNIIGLSVIVLVLALLVADGGDDRNVNRSGQIKKPDPGRPYGFARIFYEEKYVKRVKIIPQEGIDTPVFTGGTVTISSTAYTPTMREVEIQVDDELPRKYPLEFFAREGTLYHFIPETHTMNALVGFNVTIPKRNTFLGALYQTLEPCGEGKFYIKNEETCSDMMLKVQSLSKGKVIREEFIPAPKQYHHSKIWEQIGDKMCGILLIDGEETTKFCFDYALDAIIINILVNKHFASGVRVNNIIEYYIPEVVTPPTTTSTPVTTTPTTAPITTQLPSKGHPPVRAPQVVIPLNTVFGAAFGAAQVSYTHFIWIMCPHERRMTILAGYWTMVYSVQWLCGKLIFTASLKIMVILLALQIVSTLAHIGLTMIFQRRLPPLSHHGMTSDPRF